MAGRGTCPVITTIGTESIWAVGDACHQIGGAWTRGAEANTDLAGGPGVGISGVGAGLLVAHQDVLHPSLHFQRCAGAS